MKKNLKINFFTIISFCFIIYSCSTFKKPLNPGNSNKKRNIDYSLQEFRHSAPSVKIEKSTEEEITFALEKRYKNKEKSKILSLISFDSDISKLINSIDINSLKEYKYFTGEGIGVIISLYLQQGFNLQDIKWDFYKLRQALLKNNIYIFSEKGLNLLDKIILNKFSKVNAKINNDGQSIILPNCHLKGDSKHLSLYQNIRYYFDYFVFGEKVGIICSNHLLQINLFMTDKIKIDFYYLTQKKTLSVIIRNYINELKINKFSGVKYIND